VAEIAFPRVDGLGCVRVRTNLYSVPAVSGKTVEVRLYPSYVEVRNEGGASPATSAVTGGSSKCSTWNIIPMYWSANRAS
jgi:hypothetical protein